MEELTTEIQQIGSKEIALYSPIDRQRAIQIKLQFIGELKKAKADIGSYTRQRNLYKAREMKVITGTVKDRENTVIESEGYIALDVKKDEAEVTYEYIKNIVSTISELITFIRDMEKQIGEEIN